jgi:pyruvate dehydrogenase E2 component (dihydrolipoamide acetyltransferase)
MQQVLMPRIDPGMQSGRLLQWLKPEGSPVQKGEPLALVEGEKATFELEAPYAGILRKQLVAAEADVPVGGAVALIGAADEPLPAVPGLPASTRDAAVTAPTAAPSAIAPAPISGEAEPIVKISPSARRLAKDHGIDYSGLKGTGPGGRIVSEDILQVVEAGRAPMAATLAPPGAPSEAHMVGAQTRTRDVIPLSGRRRTIAERLSQSFRTTVPVLLTMEVQMGKLLHLRGTRSAERPDISLTACVVKAAAKALEKHPMLNALLEGEQIRLLGDVHVGVAIDAPAGLVAPVVRDANEKPVQDISREIEAYAAKADQGTFTPEEIVGATFTVTNLGSFEVDLFAPVINPPNAAILGIGRVITKPVLIDDRIQPMPMMILSLVFDHRIVDGAPAARFLQEIKHLLETPARLFD